MKKTRMISVIAASLLTATVVFTGCGGGGSSEATSSSSSVSSSVSSSAPASSSSSTTSSTSSTCLPGQPCGGSSSSAPSVKSVKVSDGYVLGAMVVCGAHQAVATSIAGEYEFDVASCPANIAAQNGYIDVNDNGSLDAGEPGAPKMEAPADYSNVTPYTTLIAHGMTPAEVAAAFGLPADTNFDIAIPESQDPNFVKNAVLLSAMLSYIERQAGTRGILPTPGSGAPTSSTSSSSVSSSSEETGGGEESSASALTLDTLVQKLKSGLTIEDILPKVLMPLKQALDNGTATPDQYDDVAASFLKEYNGEYNPTSSSTSSSSAQSSSASQGGQSGGGILPTPGNGGIVTGGETFPSVGIGATSSTISSSMSSSNSSASSEGGMLPTPSSSPMPVSSSSESSSSSSSAPSTPPTPSLSSSSSSSSAPSTPPTPSLGGSSSSSAPTPTTEETPGA